MAIQKIYYALKPYMPRRLQLFLRRMLTHGKKVLHRNVWPIDRNAGELPQGWGGWPDEKQFAVVLTHDVEFEGGLLKCQDLMKLEKKLGFRSSFNFVPERYPVPYMVRADLESNGFEVGVHGLNHDGKLYQSRKIFKERAARINQYLREWNVVGFRSPAMHHNLDWIHDLEIEYDASTFDTDPFEPQSDGVSTIFPFKVRKTDFQKGYVELPYTLPQDHAMFVIMRERDTRVWKRKLDWIAERGGMMLINTHPDYMNFNGKKPGLEEYPVELYLDFLQYIKDRYEGQFWHALPRDVARFWNTQSVIWETEAIVEKATV